MTDGLSIQLDPVTDTRLATTIDLTNFALWIELQSPATIANLLDVTANELYRRKNWPSIAGRLKDVTRDLRAAAR